MRSATSAGTILDRRLEGAPWARIASAKASSLSIRSSWSTHSAVTVRPSFAAATLSTSTVSGASRPNWIAARASAAWAGNSSIAAETSSGFQVNAWAPTAGSGDVRVAVGRIPGPRAGTPPR